MKPLFFVLILLPTLLFGQIFHGESKPKVKEHFKKWANEELKWEFKDSIISITCCVEQGALKYHDTVSVWVAKYPGYFEFQYFFNEGSDKYCDSLYINSTCDSVGVAMLNNILRQAIPKWRKTKDNEFVQRFSVGFVVGNQSILKMSIRRNMHGFSLLTWKTWISADEWKKLRKLEKIKTY